MSVVSPPFAVPDLSQQDPNTVVDALPLNELLKAWDFTCFRYMLVREPFPKSVVSLIEKGILEEVSGGNYREAKVSLTSFGNQLRTAIGTRARPYSTARESKKNTREALASDVAQWIREKQDAPVRFVVVDGTRTLAVPVEYPNAMLGLWFAAYAIDRRIDDRYGWRKRVRNEHWCGIDYALVKSLGVDRFVTSDGGCLTTNTISGMEDLIGRNDQNRCFVSISHAHIESKLKRSGRRPTDAWLESLLALRDITINADAGGRSMSADAVQALAPKIRQLLGNMTASCMYSELLSLTELFESASATGEEVTAIRTPHAWVFTPESGVNTESRKDS